MITLICATNRPQNMTKTVVDSYAEILRERGLDFQVFSMEELPDDLIVSDTFGQRSPQVERIMTEKIIPAEKLIVVAPEYNGSYPGVFKAFLDGIPPKTWFGKRAALVGVAAGRAGNLRGMDHLSDVFHYLRIEVFSMKVPISRLNSLLDEEDRLADEETIQVLNRQLDEFLRF